MPFKSRLTCEDQVFILPNLLHDIIDKRLAIIYLSSRNGTIMDFTEYPFQNTLKLIS